MSDTIRPSAAWYLVAAGIVVASVFAMAALTLSVLDDVVEMFNPQILEGPGEHSVAIAEAGPHTIYLQVDRRSKSPSEPLPETAILPPGLELDVVDDGGAALPLEDPTGASVARRDVGFLPQATFHATRPGVVTVRATWTAGAPDEPLVLAVGETISTGDMTSVIGHFGAVWVILFVGGGGALGIFLVTLFRRRDSRRRLEAEAVSRLLEDRRDG